ncbi:hypothetical protein AHF37_10032 [Paragonimus kellicotti]|nr:hypothetical protein AHF37_10031 [Paragonimus kellicotti]KAF6771556.1 hypothetical protein AHF37_10032 [Paragonimus kellicotti]
MPACGGKDCICCNGCKSGGKCTCQPNSCQCKSCKCGCQCCQTECH